MPIYEYACESCGHRVEQMQRMSDPPLLTCPACSEDALKRLISQTSFVLKGSGWYKTDYAAKPSPGSGGSSDASSASSSKSESKSESPSGSSSTAASDSKPKSSGD
ncbi:MAG: zinc ribbon domain-containing protein [Deltaproteobacteria bacterium]|nr:zinc ribbon domain-containing protein [Deltaproteobacteria bacterium]MCB9788750.1 zinc ribbon domain-containing protein [Deltaproteobacteria bacterium]